MTQFDKDEWMNIFFKELKTYNSTNFRTLCRVDLLEGSPIAHKAFSSVVTRFFIFCEKHPELSATDVRMLYFALRIDMISKYFADYPESDMIQLQAFQNELKKYVRATRKHTEVSNYE